MDFNKIKIQEVKKNEFRKVVKIYKDSFAVAPFNEKWSMKTAGNRIKSYLNYSKIKKICYEKEIIGVVIYYIEVWDKGNYLFVAEIAIKKEFQKRGIGKFIMNELENEAKKKKCIAMVLWTEKDSIASKMYEKLGFKIQNKAIRMVKNLK